MASPENGELSRNQARALRELVKHPKIADAAESVNLSERTIYRWMREPHFAAALKKLQDGAIADSLRELIIDLKKSNETFREIRDDENIPPTVRLRAAQLIHDYALKYSELRDIGSRLDNLEEAVESLKRRYDR